ncbi:MAG: hypothetical protein ABIL09_05705 [Gemmatimonadota bacterium]
MGGLPGSGRRAGRRRRPWSRWAAAELAAALWLTGACSGQGPGPGPGEQVFTWELADDPQGWVSLFVDYPVGEEAGCELTAGHRSLPAPLATGRGGLYISGHNRAAELGMFWKRPVDGLQPDTRYGVRFEVVLATDAPSGCAGIGGAPGASVAVCAAATTAEPVALREQGAGGAYWGLSAASLSGPAFYEASRLGDAANGRPCEASREYALKTLRSAPDHWIVRTDGAGRAWLLVGTRSGIEAPTGLYYLRLEARFGPPPECDCR